MLISGDADTVRHALSLVIEHLHSNAQARASMAMSGGAGSNNEQPAASAAGSGSASSAASEEGAAGGGEQAGGSTTSVKLLIAKGAGGLVIGRGGATIKVGGWVGRLIGQAAGVVDWWCAYFGSTTTTNKQKTDAERGVGRAHPAGSEGRGGGCVSQAL